MGISAREAGELAGVGKGAILRSIKTGRMSATKDLRGEWIVDVAELGRVYTLHTPNGTPESTQDAQGAQRELALMRELLNAKDDVIADLRGQLAATTALASQLSAVIAELKPPKAKAGWWARLLGS